MEETDFSQILQLLAALGFVLALMGGLAFLVRRLGLAGALPQPVGKKKSLKIIEVLPLDSRRKAVLLQREDKQHLVILGPNGETVVESNIKAPDSKKK